MVASPRVNHRIANAVQALLLLGGMGGLLALVGWFLAGITGTTGFLVLGLIYVLFSPRFSPALVLRLYRARPLAGWEVPGLFETVEMLARRAGLARRPGIHYVPSNLLNAFSVGGTADSAIALTDGLLRGLSGRELTGVLAHEVSHIRHNDIWIMGLADSVSRLVWLFSFSGQLLVLFNLPVFLMDYKGLPWIPILLLVAAPTISNLFQRGLSRNREFDADREAAELTSDPAGLALALEKLEWHQQGGFWGRIFSPARRDPQPSLLRTHPATHERIARLKELAGAEEPPLAPSFAELVLPVHWPEITLRPRRRWHGLRY